VLFTETLCFIWNKHADNVEPTVIVTSEILHKRKFLTSTGIHPARKRY